ncbi:hypothetical protein FOZ63_013281, partial [Perkinsus olseni]
LRLLSWTNLTGLDGTRRKFDRVADALEQQQQQDSQLEDKSRRKMVYLGSWSMGAGSSAVIQENDDDRILEVQRLTAELSLYCGLSSADADNLLKYHRYEIDEATKAFEEDPIKALQDAGVSKIPKYLLDEAKERGGQQSGVSSVEAPTTDTSVEEGKIS